MRKYGPEGVAPDKIATQECEIFSPNALGAGVNDESLGKFRCKVIAGGANNQLAEARHGDALRELGILYVPDYVINAGGLMNVFVELEGYSAGTAVLTRKVYDNCMKVLKSRPHRISAPTWRPTGMPKSASSLWVN